MRKEFIRGVWILLPRRIHPKSLVINVIFLRAVGMHAEPLSALSQGSHTPDQSAAPPGTPRSHPAVGRECAPVDFPSYSAPPHNPDQSVGLPGTLQWPPVAGQVSATGSFPSYCALPHNLVRSVAPPGTPRWRPEAARE